MLLPPKMNALPLAARRQVPVWTAPRHEVLAAFPCCGGPVQHSYPEKCLWNNLQCCIYRIILYTSTTFMPWINPINSWIFKFWMEVKHLLWTHDHELSWCGMMSQKERVIGHRHNSPISQRNMPKPHNATLSFVLQAGFRWMMAGITCRALYR